MKSNLNPDEELEKIIKNSDIGSVLKDYTETMIDKVIDNEFIKDIPLLSSIVASIKFGNSINEHFFRKKIFNFLFELRVVPQERRKKIIDKLNTSSKYQNKVGETIIEIVDKIESEEKPNILGKMFVAVLEEKINYLIFLKAAHILKSVFYYDLLDLKSNCKGEYIDNYSNDYLVIAGIINVEYSSFVDVFENNLNSNRDDYNLNNDSVKTKLTEVGKLIIEIGMK